MSGGSGVDEGAHAAGGFLDRVGAYHLADQVDDFGDAFAADLGAHIGEKQLGQTERSTDLVHGNPTTIRAGVKHLADFSTAFGLLSCPHPAPGAPTLPAPGGLTVGWIRVRVTQESEISRPIRNDGNIELLARSLDGHRISAIDAEGDDFWVLDASYPPRSGG
ncbi:putative T7SS-secreted protein [Streptomyces sp. NPDC050485]|uniref:putative T7SS-secreted protein n=1 Tax=Streptomyces sp. NPDC050485 TaxID=3365617 RepID=UPI0037BABCB3